MALTVNQAFDELLSRVELNQSRIDLASQRYAAVKAHLETALPGKTVRQIGSFQRRTKIRPADLESPWDIDVSVCFGDVTAYATDGNGITPQRSLEIVRGALTSNQNYLVMDPMHDAPIVVLEYADRFKIELVPCYRERTGKYARAGEPPAYIVPTPHGAWAPADYDFDAQLISSLNQGPAAGNLVPAIKMLKGFVRAQSLALKSFHVEVLCALTVPGLVRQWQLAGLQWQSQHLFAHALTHAAPLLSGSVRLPGSHSLPVDSGLTSDQRALTQATFEKYGEMARKMIDLNGADGIVNLWRQLYGAPFPAG